MKLLKKVRTIEVKRCFVVGNFIKITNGRKHYLGRIPREIFEKKLQASKKKVLKLTEIQLDTFIANEFQKRLDAFNSSDWYLSEVRPSEVGVWRKAGGLPLSWTNGSLAETAKKVRRAIEQGSKLFVKRTGHAIPNMLRINTDKLQKEKYLLPIIFKDGTGTNGRRRLKRRMRGDIDDGCMRSIALTINGATTIRAYFGLPKDPRK